MNERIRELADQAGFVRFEPDEDPHTPIDWSCDYSMELNQFAELIVQECACRVDNILRERKDGGGTMGDEIREHFGVK